MADGGNDRVGAVSGAGSTSAGADGVPTARAVDLFADPSIALARQRLEEAAARHTTTVGYVSGGHCLVIGEPTAALDAAARLALPGATLVHVDAGDPRVSKALAEDGTALFTVPALTLEGHLGAFVATGVAADGTTIDLGVSARRPEARFDLVLDLSPTPRFTVRLPPFGYVHAPDAAALDAAVESLAGLVGEFDKPRYFAYDASICAHSRSRLTGCSSCIDVCVAGAITSSGEGVAVDPYLCQGCGSCATLCPTGAMVYAYPKPSDAIARTRAALAEGTASTLVLHAEAARPALDAAALGADTLALEVEEVSAFGIDYWATMLCAGVGRVLVVTDAVADDPNRRAVEAQAALLHRLVAGLGIGPEAVQVVPSRALADLAALPGPSPVPTALVDPPAFATHDDKRATLRTALETLERLVPTPVPAPPPIEPLPAGAPFGHILVDTDACTLCMACVSTCPAGALLDGRDTPALRLIEANCVQCGLCERACPEDAIALEARYVRDGVAARRARTLHEEAPFRCVACHKPFATQAMIDTMLGKLAGHWMFRDARSLRRLEMCEDCRVRDIFDSEGDAIDVHAGAARSTRDDGAP